MILVFKLKLIIIALLADMFVKSFFGFINFINKKTELNQNFSENSI